MPFKTPFSRIYFFLCFCCALFTLPGFLGVVHAAGLGKLSVLSALGQPLRAEIELTSVSKNELGTLKIKLASLEAFHRANLELNPALQSARFTIGQRDTRYFVTIASTQVMNEPFVSMLLELNWNEGRLLREYTFLLDPPELQNAQEAQSLKLAQTLNSVDATNAASNANTGNGSDAKGQSETLKAAKIAKPVNQEKVARKQKVIQAAVKNPAPQPTQVISAPAPVFTPTLVPSTQLGEKNFVKDKKSNKTDVAALNQSEDKLQVSRGLALALSLSLSSSPSSGSGATSTRSQAAPRIEEKTRIVMPEDRIAKDKMIADATERIKELEKNVSDLQKFVQLKTNELANQASGSQPQQGTATTQVGQMQTTSLTSTLSHLPAFSSSAAVPVGPVKSIWAEQVFVREWMGDLRFISAALALLIAVIAGGVAFFRSQRKTDDFESYAASLAGTDHVKNDRHEQHALKREPSVDASFVANQAETTPQFDFSTINLDLDTELEANDIADIDKEISNKANNANKMDDSAIAMKLDLASAYDHIGDKQGARELLDEVIKNGSAEQVAKATALLKKMMR